MAEAGRSDGRIPLVLLGGFLGAGKSTWLRHRLFEGRYRGHHIVINEAAETPVDNLLLGNSDSITILAGGCACCSGLKDLVAELRRLCNAASGPAIARLEGILLETSGLADPGPIAAALAADPILSRRLIVSQTQVLVDALYGLDQISNEPLARAQIEAADELILTKPSAIDPVLLARLAATLRTVNPEARISAAEFGVTVPLPQIDAPPHDLPLPAQEAPIHPYRLYVGQDGGWVALSTWLSALLAARGDDVVRVKGVVRVPAGRLLLQSVRRIVQAPEILPEDDSRLGALSPEEGVIVLIGRNINATALARSWQRFGA